MGATLSVLQLASVGTIFWLAYPVGVLLAAVIAELLGARQGISAGLCWTLGCTTSVAAGGVGFWLVRQAESWPARQPLERRTALILSALVTLATGLMLYVTWAHFSFDLGNTPGGD